MANTRYLSAKIINEVTNGRSLTDSLETHVVTLPDSRDRAFVQALCYGVCRYYTQLDVILSELLQKPMNAKDSDVHALLLAGLFQLKWMRLPDYAAVTETVNATAKLKKPWSRALTNAILRRYLREKDRIDKIIEQDEEAFYAHPDWWIRFIKKSWPSAWQDILTANNVHPPFSLRVNLKKIGRDAYLDKLKAAALQAAPILETAGGIVLAEPINVDNLPGFAEGEISVQDGAAQLCAGLLDIQDGQRILDACAAPGGKLTHILECADHLQVVAVENEKSRLSSIKDNLRRLRCEALVVCADAADTKKWWDGKLFDRILLDAPCSASGVIRRHPDIKLLRNESDIRVLAREQERLLTALRPLLAPDGMLVYATCSIFQEENDDVVARFLAKHPDMKARPIAADWGLPTQYGRQILPGLHQMDGFYYAVLSS